MRYFTDDRPAARSYEILDLQIDDRSFVISGETKISPIADYLLIAGVSVSDFRRCAAVDVNAVQDREHGFAFVDQLPIMLADFNIQLCPRVTFGGTVGH